MVILSMSSPNEIGARMSWIGSGLSAGCGAGAGLADVELPELLLQCPCHPLHHLIPVALFLLEEQPHRGIPEGGIAV